MDTQLRPGGFRSWGLLFLFIGSVTFAACAKDGGSGVAPSALTLGPEPGQPEPPSSPHPTEYVSLPWEDESAPERKKWSDFTFEQVEANLSTLNQASDIKSFCPRYDKLSGLEQTDVWGLLIAEVSFFESGWDPTTRSLEPTMGKDQVTGEKVYSEGLLQLSYQDSLWDSSCKFDWHHDKPLPVRDPDKTILNPVTNLRCGISILVRQIEIHGAVVLNGEDVYWSTLRKGSATAKDIEKRIKEDLKFCLETGGP